MKIIFFRFLSRIIIGIDGDLYSDEEFFFIAKGFEDERKKGIYTCSTDFIL